MKAVAVALTAMTLVAGCSSQAGEQQEADADAGAVENDDAGVVEDADAEDVSSGGDADAADSGPSDTGTGDDAGSSDDAGTSTSLCDSVAELRDYSDWDQATDIESPWGEDEEHAFANIFNSWPGTGNSTVLGLLRGEYFSLSFETGQLDETSDGRIGHEKAPSLDGNSRVGMGPLIASFSRCPGDFDPDSPAVPSPECVMSIPNLIYQIWWGGPGSGENCELESETEYYLNLVYTDSDLGDLPPEQATCDEEKPRCGHIWMANGTE